MRPRLDQNRLRRAMSGEDFEHVAHVPSFVRPRAQLADTTGSRAAFTEAVVAVGVHGVLARQALEISTTGMNGFAPVEHDAGDTLPGEFVRAEHAARAVPHDQDACGPRDFDGVW